MGNGKEKLRCRGQNENVKHTAVGETEGESRETGAIGREKDDGISGNWKTRCSKSILWSVLADRCLEAWGTNGQDAVHGGPQTPPLARGDSLSAKRSLKGRRPGHRHPGQGKRLSNVPEREARNVSAASRGREPLLGACLWPLSSTCLQDLMCCPRFNWPLLRGKQTQNVSPVPESRYRPGMDWGLHQHHLGVSDTQHLGSAQIC